MSPSKHRGLRPGSFWTLFNHPGGWLFVAFLAVAGVASWFLQLKHVGTYEQKPWVESFTIPQAEYVRTLACGYDKWLADMLLLRAIQAYGGVSRERLEDDYDPVYNFFHVVSTLDPGFIEAYQFGNLVMGDGGGDYHGALTYLDFGERHNWQKHSPWYEAAFNWMDAVKDGYGYREWEDKTNSWLWPMSERLGWHDRARFHVRMAARCPDAPDWMDRWEHKVDKEEGLFEAAMFKWAVTYADGVKQDADYLAGIGERNIILSAHDWHNSILSKAMESFKTEEGRWPVDLQEVDEMGYLPPQAVVDPALFLARLEAYRAAGRPIEPDLEELFNASKVEKGGLLPCIEPPTEDFVIVHLPGDNREVAMRSKAFLEIQKHIPPFRQAIMVHLVKNKAYPDTLDEAVMPHTGFSIPEPFGNGWFYDPETGEVRSNTYPLDFQHLGLTP